MPGGWWQSTDRELCDAITELETRMRRDYATLLTILGEADTRGLAKSCGYATLPHLLQDLVRVSAAEAKRRVEQALAITPARMITGTELPPPLPITGEAAREGELSADHIAMIHRHIETSARVGDC